MKIQQQKLMDKVNQQNKWLAPTQQKPMVKSSQNTKGQILPEKLMVQKNNCSNPDNKSQWFKSRRQKPMV